MEISKKFFIVGGAGFIGSHFVDHFIRTADVEKITLFDNFSSGREWHYAQHRGNPKLQVVRGDVKDLDLLKTSMSGHDTVIHLASNPDIARAATDPAIDFVEGTVLTHHVLEAMRCTSAKRILYTSGSGVFGEIGDHEADENFGPLVPISTYGASKLAGETLISAYCHMFGLSGCVFRFGNVVGARQTHGVGYDFIRRLVKDGTQLRILGDGKQSKSYIHISDVVKAVLLVNERSKKAIDTYNVATGDYITVQEIADIAVDISGLDRKSVQYQFSGGDRGWKGDVPVVRLNIEKIKSLGWAPSYTSRMALRASMAAMIEEVKS